MAAACLRRNQVIDIDGRAYRMIQLLPSGSWELKNVCDGQVDLIPKNELLSLVQSGRVTLRVSDMPAERLASSLRQAINPPLHLRGPKREAIEALQDCGGERVSAETVRKRRIQRARSREKLVAAAEKYSFGSKAQLEAIEHAWAAMSPRIGSAAPHFTTVWRWRQKLIVAGGDRRALVDRDDLKGRQKYAVHEEVASLIAEAVDDIYMSRERKPITDVYDELKTRIAAENTTRSEIESLPLPPISRVREYILELPEFDKYAARYGYQAATRKFRAVLNTVHAERPLQRIELDATRLDLMVTDDDGFPMGRPWLHVALDVRTRCVVGYYISFEPPSLATLFECIKHAVLPKDEEQLVAWGIRSGYPVYGVWEVVVMDNAFENHSDGLSALADLWGLDLQFCPRAKPWFKGKVERLIGTLVRGICHGVPGTTFANIFDKADYDPVKHAVLPLSELKRVAAIYICKIYHNRPHKVLGESPIAAWRRLVKEEDILLPTSAREIEQVCRVPEVKRLTHKGIEMLGITWNSLALQAVRRRSGAEIDVRVFINRMNLATVGVEDPETREIIEVAAVGQDSYVQGLTLYQHNVIRNFNANRRAANDEAALLEGKHLILQIVDEAKHLKGFKMPTDAARFAAATCGGGASSNAAGRGCIADAKHPQPMSGEAQEYAEFWGELDDAQRGVTSEPSEAGRMRHEA